MCLTACLSFSQSVCLIFSTVVFFTASTSGKDSLLCRTWIESKITRISPFFRITFKHSISSISSYQRINWAKTSTILYYVYTYGSCQNELFRHKIRPIVICSYIKMIFSFNWHKNLFRSSDNTGFRQRLDWKSVQSGLHQHRSGAKKNNFSAMTE